MKEVLAIIRPDKMNATKRALAQAGIHSMHAKDCLGRGKGLVDLTALKGAELGYEEAIAQLGQTRRLIPKRMVSIIVPDKLVSRVVETVINTNKTGKSGDGKIFVMPVHDATRVRTGEIGDSVLDE
jgi:nitrogen regulatory protein PII 2